MDIETKLELIKRTPTEEIITEQDLKQLLETKNHPIAYDGFEPSGEAHLGSGLLRAIKLQDMLDAGCKFKLLVADWFGWINNKMGGDLEKVQQAGKYLVEAWKACGVDTKKVEIVWTNDVVRDSEYWKLVIDIAKITTINRMIRASTVMGREEKEMQYTAQILYPAMQTADPFYLNADICQLGMDQRKCTILSRELGPKIGKWSLVCVHHHLLMGLQGPTRMGKEIDEVASKMSKSKPLTCVFIHDTNEEIKKKIMASFCPEKAVEGNPLLEICKYVLFRKNKTMNIERSKKFGGPMEFHSYEELERAFREGKLHPLDLKNSVSEELIKILEPVRKYFEKNKEAKELLQTVQSMKITR